MPTGNSKDQAYLLGMLSSRILDWYARRYVEIHLNFYIFNNLPIPRLANNNLLKENIIKISGRLAAVDKRYEKWAKNVGVKFGAIEEKNKLELIYELDALVALAYGLNQSDINTIFQTFHTGWDFNNDLMNTLKYYDKWTKK